MQSYNHYDKYAHLQCNISFIIRCCACGHYPSSFDNNSLEFVLYQKKR